MLFFAAKAGEFFVRRLIQRCDRVNNYQTMIG